MKQLLKARLPLVKKDTSINGILLEHYLNKKQRLWAEAIKYAEEVFFADKPTIAKA